MARKIDIGPYSAYAIAVKHGFKGTEAEWVAAQEAARLGAEAAAERARSIVEGAIADINAAGASQTAAVEQKGAEVLGSIPEDYSRLSESITEISDRIFENSVVEDAINISEIGDVSSLIGWNGTASLSSGNVGVSFSKLASYDSYYFIVQNECDVWFSDADISSNYLAIIVGRNFERKIENTSLVLLLSTAPIRYRESEGNLPTETNKLHLNYGDVLAFTLTAGTMSKVYGLSSHSVLSVKNDFKKEVIIKPHCIVSEGKITIVQNKAEFDVEHCVSASINQDCWRIIRGALLDKQGGKHYMWDGSDADGVLRLVTDGALEPDFVGGYHGDELTDEIKMYSDGVEVDLTESAEFDFDSLELLMKSNVYHANGGSLCFERYKVIEFDGDSVKVKNNFIAKDTVNVAVADLGMLSVERGLVNSYYGNNDYLLHTNTETVTSNTELDHAIVNTPYGKLDYTYNGKKLAYEGYVQSYSGTGVSNRLKWYFSDVHVASSRAVVLNANDTIRGEYELSTI